MPSNESISQIVVSNLNNIIQSDQSNVLLDVPFISDKVFDKLSVNCQIIDVRNELVYLPEDNKLTTIIKNLHLIKFKKDRIYSLSVLRNQFKDRKLIFISPLTETNLLRIQSNDLKLKIVKVNIGFSQYENCFSEKFLQSI